MNSITNNTVRVAVVALAAFAVIAVSAIVAIAPKAHAADLGFDDYSGGYGYSDQYSGGYGYSDQYAGGYGYSDQYSGGNGYGTASNYYDQYSGGNPSYDYGSGYSGCSSCGGGFSGGGFGGSGFSGFGGFGGGGSTFAPTTVSNNVPTTIYSPSNTNICTGGNTCNSTVDDHSIFNAPTTVTVTNPAPAQTQVVYQQVPVYQQPNYPVYNQTPCCYQQYQQPVVYPVTRQPYVSLNQVPYTGLDLGPVGTVVYWGFLVLWCLVAAYLIVYKRVQTKVVSGLNTFLFGQKVGTHAKVVMPAASHSTHTAPKAYVAPVAKNDDAIDPFIASQIARNK